MQPHKLQNILEQPQPHPNNTRPKMAYLHAEKERLQIEVAELIQHNQLLRTINKQLTNHSSPASNSQIVAQLNQQNHLLQQSYLRILEQNERLSSELLMAQQIQQQSLAQQQAIAKDYEQKIVQLRRSIQVKQSSIQQLQKKLKTEDSIITPATNVTLLFFNEIDELKKGMQYLSVKNKQLQRQNKQYMSKSDKLQKQLTLLQTLTTQSKLTYNQFKHYYQHTHHKRNHSAPKHHTCLPFTHQHIDYHPKPNYHHNNAEIGQCTGTSMPVDCSVKLLVYKQSLQIAQLRDKYRQVANKLKGELQLKQKIAVLNSQLSNRVNTLVGQLNYYKKSTQQLMQALSSKGRRVSSCQKIPIQHLVSTIKQPAEISYLSQRRKFWVGVQQSIKVDRLKLLHIKNKYKGSKRSLSCFVDYHRRQQDNTQKYLNKQAVCTTDKPSRNKMEQSLHYGSNDFSLFIEQLEGDISIIQSSQQPKNRTTYSDWKRNKNAVNLTILQQNIL